MEAVCQGATGSQNPSTADVSDVDAVLALLGGDCLRHDDHVHEKDDACAPLTSDKPGDALPLPSPTPTKTLKRARSESDVTEKLCSTTWAERMRADLGVYRAAKGEQLRKVRMASLCSGLGTETYAMKELRLHHDPTCVTLA